MCLRVGADRTLQHRSICRLKRCLVCVELEEELHAVPTITCVMRWAPAELAAGLSDPEIIEAAKSDERFSIVLNSARRYTREHNPPSPCSAACCPEAAPTRARSRSRTATCPRRRG